MCGTNVPEYPLATLITIVVVLLAEFLWLRTGLFAKAKFWIALVIMLSFQVLVDGWLTKLYDPIVMYNPDTMLGLRWPLDIPVEDWGFGFALIALTLMIWEVTGRKRRDHIERNGDTP